MRKKPALSAPPPPRSRRDSEIAGVVNLGRRWSPRAGPEYRRPRRPPPLASLPSGEPHGDAQPQPPQPSPPLLVGVGASMVSVAKLSLRRAVASCPSASRPLGQGGEESRTAPAAREFATAVPAVLVEHGRGESNKVGRGVGSGDSRE